VETDLQAIVGLDGKVTAVTGAASGLGAAIAGLLARAGARVVLLDVDASRLSQAASDIGGDCLYYPVDISDRERVESVTHRILDEAGRLDVWVNCAGLGYIHPMLQTDPDRAERVIAVNMMGTYWCCVAAGRVMGERGGGAIVNISSGGGSNPSPGTAVYSMTKGAVNSLTWTAAAELGPSGVRVNCVSPGWFETPMSSSMYSDESGKPDPARREALIEMMTKRTPLGRTGVPADIAHAVLYLASDASAFVTGQIISVNGGMAM